LSLIDFFPLPLAFISNFQGFRVAQGCFFSFVLSVVHLDQNEDQNETNKKKFFSFLHWPKTTTTPDTLDEKK